MLRRRMITVLAVGAATAALMSSTAADASVRGAACAAPAAATPLPSAGSVSEPQGPPASPAAGATKRERLPEWIEHGLRRHGPVAVFFAFIVAGAGIHLSEDLILIPAGFLAASDPEHPVRLFWEFAFWAYAGIVLGDGIWFLLCRTIGTRFLRARWFRRLMHPRRILELKHQMDLRGAWVLLAARFIPGARTPVITMAGVLHLAWWKFLAVELSCVLLTVPIQMSIGWSAASAAVQAGVTRLSHQIALAVAVTVAVVLALALLHRWIRARLSRHRPPRSAARWLRSGTPGDSARPK